jgi:long-chain acyl-CoA synthetase
MATQLSSSPPPPFVPLQPVERDTITKLFFGAIDRLNRPDAMRYKQGGQWRTLSHRVIEERVTQLAAALRASGVQRGDRVAILAENRPEWAIADFAVLCLGATDVPIYPTLPPNQIAYILNDCEAKVIFCSTAEQVEKVAGIRDEVPTLREVIVFDEVTDATVSRWGDVLSNGEAEITGGRFTDFRDGALAVQPDDLATLIYTSGTTGDPKGVMLTHFNICSNVAAVHQHRVLEVTPGEVALSFLPLSHSFERLVDYFYWDSGICIAYAESIEKLAENLVEVSPHLVAAAPRVFEKIYTKVMGATGIKRTLVMWAKGVGEERAEAVLAGRAAPESLGFRIADKLVFSKLRAKTGGRVRAFISGSAPLSADVAKFFFAAGLPVYEGYGLTETSPVLAVNKPGKVKLGTVGIPLAGVEMRIAESGEILARGPNIMKGYWNRPQDTADTIDADGWLHTGDVGEFDEEGFLRITDRIKNMIVTAGGKNIAPQPIENQAAMSPYVSQVLMIGDRRAFPTLLVVPDFENLERWAREKGIGSSNREEMARDPRVKQFLEQETLGRLQGLARYEIPKKIMVAPEDFTIESGALTPTLKVKRRVVEERYRDSIEEMYEAG